MLTKSIETLICDKKRDKKHYLHSGSKPVREDQIRLIWCKVKS